MKDIAAPICLPWITCSEGNQLPCHEDILTDLPTWCGTEVSCQQSRGWTILEVDSLGLVNLADDYSRSQHHEITLMRDSKQELAYPNT